MPGFDATSGTLTIPVWTAGALSAIFVVAVVLAITRAGAGNLVSTMLRIVAVAIAVYAAWFYLQRSTQQEHAAERRSLDERAAALLARAIAPGSALSCLDELAGETVEVACEKAVFASPEAVAAAVSYTSAKAALLADGSEHARRVDAAYEAELEPLRASLELDRFGIVAHVLAEHGNCTLEKCDALLRFRDQSHILTNLRDHTFEDEVTKFTAMWNAPRVSDAVAAAAPPMPQNLSQPGQTVAPRYDFPSAQSIPPVNIMTAEPPPPRAPPNAQPAVVPGDGAQPVITPVPPRRPPQVRSGPAADASRTRSVAPAAAAAAAGEAPVDGAVPRPAAPVSPR
jgi:hypothetical protein